MRDYKTIKYKLVFSTLTLLIFLSLVVAGADFDASLEEKKIVFTTDFTNTGVLDLKIGGGSGTESSNGISLSSLGVMLNLESDCEECGGISGEITGAVIETKMHSKAYDINVEAILDSGRVFGNYAVGGSTFLSVIDTPVSIEQFSETTNSSDGNGTFSSTTIEKYYETRAEEVWTFTMNGGYAGFFTSMSENGNGGDFLNEE